MGRTAWIIAVTCAFGAATGCKDSLVDGTSTETNEGTAENNGGGGDNATNTGGNVGGNGSDTDGDAGVEDHGGTNHGGGMQAADCLPSEAAFTMNALPIIKQRCSECHGETPQQGAPFSLLHYDALVAGKEGHRIVDRMVNALSTGAMPPPGTHPLPREELHTLTGWASCGLVHPDPQRGLEASREPVSAPPNPPEGAVPVDLGASELNIRVTDLNRYYDKNFSGIVSEERFIRRFEPLIDDARVVHHITLRHRKEGVGTRYLYAWGPGGDTVELPNGGIRIGPTDEFLVEIHYNNGAGLTDVRDSSGVRLWVTEPEGIEYGMSNPGTWDFQVPAHGSASAKYECTATEAVRIVAGYPHMHATGSEFYHLLEHADGSTDSIIELTGWNFDAQRIYDIGIDVVPGDKLKLTCVYDNPTDKVVKPGIRTENEMCFHFIYVTPPHALDACNDKFSLGL